MATVSLYISYKYKSNNYSVDYGDDAIIKGTGDDDDDDNHKNKLRGDACYVKKSRMQRSFNTNYT